MPITLTNLPAPTPLRDIRTRTSIGPIRVPENARNLKVAGPGPAPLRVEQTTVAFFARLEAESLQNVWRLTGAAGSAPPSPDEAVQTATAKYEAAYRMVMNERARAGVIDA